LLLLFAVFDHNKFVPHPLICFLSAKSERFPGLKHLCFPEHAAYMKDLKEGKVSLKDSDTFQAVGPSIKQVSPLSELPYNRKEHATSVAAVRGATQYLIDFPHCCKVGSLRFFFCFVFFISPYVTLFRLS
jgi:hypothetical protein